MLKISFPFRVPSRRVQGFTIFEVIVAMFVLLMGVVGVIAVFSAGMNVRMRAQEIVLSQELGNMWADWVRFRINPELKASGGALAAGLKPLDLTDLARNKAGDFYECTGDFHGDFTPSGTGNLPTYHRNVYQGYRWRITQVNANYKPRWTVEQDGTVRDWTERKDGNPIWGTGDFGPMPQDLTEVELTITRGGRRYKFNYVFAGVGLKYDDL